MAPISLLAEPMESIHQILDSDTKKQEDKVSWKSVVKAVASAERNPDVLPRVLVAYFLNPV